MNRNDLERKLSDGGRLTAEESEFLYEQSSMDRYSCPDCGAWFASPVDSPSIQRDKAALHLDVCPHRPKEATR